MGQSSFDMVEMMVGPAKKAYTPAQSLQPQHEEHLLQADQAMRTIEPPTTFYLLSLYNPISFNIIIKSSFFYNLSNTSCLNNRSNSNKNISYEVQNPLF